MSVHGWSAPEVGVAFERAEHLAQGAARRAHLFFTGGQDEKGMEQGEAGDRCP